jgi:ABC-2 type transport system permease protein
VHSRVVLALLRVALMGAMQYRASFLLEFLVGAFSAVGIVVPLWIVFEQVEQVGGWSFPEALLVTAFFLVLQGLVGTFVEPNLGAVVQGVRTGQLDYLLLKPPDAQLVASMTSVAPARLWEVLAGFAAGAWAMRSLPRPGAGDLALALGLQLSGFVAVYGLWVIVTTTSFWFVRVDNLRWLLNAVMDTGRWPVSIYRGWVRLVLTVVVPVAVVTSFPAMAVLGRIDGSLVAQAGAVALGMFAVSRAFWVVALRHYTSASS